MKLATRLVAAIAAMFFTAPVYAHFPWLVVDEDGRATYFFGENLSDRDYKLPESIAKAQVFSMVDGGRTSELKLQAKETENFVGLQSADAVDRNATLVSAADFGIYHSTRLRYYTIYQGKLEAADADNSVSPRRHDFQAHVVRNGKDIAVHVTFRDQPLKNAEVKLSGPGGESLATSKTDQSGQASFPSSQMAKGLNGLLIGTTFESKGDVGGKAYASESHYLTLTFINE